MLASDVRIATPTARGNAAFIKIGLSACDIGVSYFLPRLVGASVASELMLTGRFINAERSASLGLVSKIVAADQLEGEARQLLSEMHATTPLGLRLTKECLNFSIDAAACSGSTSTPAWPCRSSAKAAMSCMVAPATSLPMEFSGPGVSPRDRAEMAR